MSVFCNADKMVLENKINGMKRSMTSTYFDPVNKGQAFAESPVRDRLQDGHSNSTDEGHELIAIFIARIRTAKNYNRQHHL